MTDIAVLDTPRLRLRPMVAGDAGFLLGLLNEAEFLRQIGDRGVRSHADAERYIANGPVASYQRHGFGLLLVERKCDGAALGIAGLLKREHLDDVDMGYALTASACGQGYAGEAARALLEHAHTVLGFVRLIAIVMPHNLPSLQLLQRLGFTFERTLPAEAGQHELHRYGIALPA
ncbi:MAG: GNAT family N-acetyltransferase [Xanthomonadaceae bacterium]|nr:GNAT family N-acetyltransferase [Xanthomonadaceae bacterium]MDP2186090.1 GNAT family N-acetyltransferase [Xanthomonadales bacterium]MDZ4117485.1 GNAT family N-acetyltransferase [Xanthomonadaceae bacterium]MDZ4379443.1 GNAT family N-acetyltransferase [Xanthomonadaceae bacterium]